MDDDHKSEAKSEEQKKSDRVMAFATLGIAVAAIANLAEGKSWLFASVVSIVVFVGAVVVARLARQIAHNKRNRQDN